MKPMDDHELERMLREVPIPAKLKENLRRIPDQGSSQSVVKTNHSGRGSAIAWMASLATAAALVFMLTRTWVRKADENSPKPIETAKHENVQQQIADCLRRMEEINAEMDVAIAESQLASQRSSISGIDARLGPPELHSLILAESSRAALQFGLSTEVVKSDLQSIQKRFPNTHGAVIAQNLLDQSEFN